MVVIEVPYQTRFEVEASAQEAFELVADVHRSGLHFPGVDSLVPTGDEGGWCWALAERGFGPIKLRVRYQAIYVSDADAMSVDWRPAEVPGDMDSHGSWRVSPRDAGGAILDFESRTVARIPAPGMMAAMVESFARNELLGLKASYIDAIRDTLNGL
jgi:carbon monoxide dehydrogenase subunit G